MKKIYYKPAIYVKELKMESMVLGLSITTPDRGDRAPDEPPTQSSNPDFFKPATEGGGGVIGDKEWDF